MAGATASADLMMSISNDSKASESLLLLHPDDAPNSLPPPLPPPQRPTAMPSNKHGNDGAADNNNTATATTTVKKSPPSAPAATVEMLNPFVHKLELVTSAEKIQTAILTVLVLPVRLVCIFILLVSAWALACIGLYGVSEEKLASKPMSGWRLSLKSVISTLGRWSYAAGGMSVRVRGEQARREDAAILVLAPHSTFLDSVIVYVTNMCSVMVRKESMDNYAGKLINFTQPLYVWRDDPNSRQNTIKKIIERANSKDKWPQIIIFPEGTCTNRSCLITFKPGAFYPGVPIQPVCIRYPNELDTVTWTWEGPGFFKLIWLTLTRVHSYCEIEFLPVYTPSEEEKADPKLYAKNVRAVMAKALAVPVSDYTFNDCKLMAGAKARHIPQAAQIVEIDAHRRALGLHERNTEMELIKNRTHNGHPNLISFPEFMQRLQINDAGRTAAKLFAIFDPDETGTIDIRAYLLCTVYLLKRDHPKMVEYFEQVAKLFASECDDFTVETLAEVLLHTGMPRAMEHCEGIFNELKASGTTVTVATLLNYLEKLPQKPAGIPRAKIRPIEKIKLH